MPISLQELEREARQLAPEEREGLINRLASSLQGEPLAEVDQAWLKEAERRRSELRSGAVVGLPSPVVFDSVREALGWKR